jgi:UDP-N-acetylenolpyruvoylglucosamine reductase
MNQKKVTHANRIDLLMAKEQARKEKIQKMRAAKENVDLKTLGCTFKPNLKKGQEKEQYEVSSDSEIEELPYDGPPVHERLHRAGKIT